MMSSFHILYSVKIESNLFLAKFLPKKSCPALENSNKFQDTKNMLHYTQLMRKDGLQLDLIVFTHIIRHFSLMPDTPQMLFWWSEMTHNEVRE